MNEAAIAEFAKVAKSIALTGSHVGVGVVSYAATASLLCGRDTSLVAVGGVVSTLSSALTYVIARNFLQRPGATSNLQRVVDKSPTRGPAS